jgi:hypothetical protein
MDAGVLNVDDTLTPLTVHWKGPTAGRSFTLLTGAEDVDVTGVIVQIDEDGPDVWLNDKLWTGDEWKPVKFYK